MNKSNAIYNQKSKRQRKYLIFLKSAFKFIKKKGSLTTSIILLSLLLTLLTSNFVTRYKTENTMQLPVTELSNAEYPENTAYLSRHFKKYSNRKITVIKKDPTHFDFVLEPTDEKTAKIIIKNVDLKLLVAKVPKWVKQDRGLEAIAFVEREWNRQQVSFPIDSEHIEIKGGDGFEKKNLDSIILARNCLNAGYWEILLSTKENGRKSLLYQGWFNFPLGHYKDVFEKINGISYWKHMWKLEHWPNLAGTVANVDLLRKVIDEKEVPAEFPLNEKIIVAGEQSRKVRTLKADNLKTWGDIYKYSDQVEFATFRPPGLYDFDKPWKNQYWRIGKFEKAIVRNIKPVGVEQILQEVELSFIDTKNGEKNRLFISGIDLKQLPRLSPENYNQGFYMPMGIGVPPFNQSYKELKDNPPDENPYFSFLLNPNNRWVGHRKLAVDGPVMHLDKDDPNLLHVYLLSYERHTLVGHFKITLDYGIESDGTVI